MSGDKKKGYKPKIRKTNEATLIKKYNQDKISIRKQKGCGCGNVKL